MAAAALGILLPSQPASAEGFFEMLFGGDSRSPSANSYADPRDSMSSPSGAPGVVIQRKVRSSSSSTSGSSTSGGSSSGGSTSSSTAGSSTAVSYCVRGCDGRYFPVASSRAGAAEACNSFCPAARTTVFHGRDIDSASDARGRPYASSENAFVYREKLVPGCTCDGKSPTGLAHIDVKDDPTLKAGDIVATKSGFAAFAGGRKNQEAQFAPVSAQALGANLQRQLSETSIRPRRHLEAVTSGEDPVAQLDVVSDNASAARQTKSANNVRVIPSR